jgi:ASC-1-like (ASCH) protein
MENFLAKPIKNKPDAPYFDWIKDGSKTYEGRLKYKCKKTEWNLYIGKKMYFYDEDNMNDVILIEITSLPIFTDFAEAFDVLEFSLIPNKSRKEVINMYNDLFHYDDEILIDGVTSKMIIKEGVVAIGFKIIS